MNLIPIPESLLQQHLELLARIAADLMKSGSTVFYIITLIQNIVGSDFLVFSFSPTHVSVSTKGLNNKYLSSSQAINSGYHMQRLQMLTRLLQGPLDDRQTNPENVKIILRDTLSQSPDASPNEIAGDGTLVDNNHDRVGQNDPLLSDTTKICEDAIITMKYPSDQEPAKLDVSKPPGLTNVNSLENSDEIQIESYIISRLEKLAEKYENMNRQVDPIRGVTCFSYILSMFLDQKKTVLAVHFVAAVFASTSGSPSFSGSKKDFLAASVIGVVAAFLLFLSEGSRFFNPIQVFLSSVICGFLAFLWCYYDKDVSFWPTVLGATLWNLPGFMLTAGAIEIIYFNPSKGTIGTSMLIKGVSDGITMALGFSISVYIGRSIFNEHHVPLTISANTTDQFSQYMVTAISSPLLTIGSTFLMEGSWAQAIYTLIPMTLCYIVYFACFNLGVPDPISEFLASISVGMMSLFISGMTEDCYLVYVYTAMLPVVPGGMFVKGMFGVIEELIFGNYNHPEAEKFTRITYPLFVSSITSAFIVGLGIIVSDSIYNILLKKPLGKFKTFIQRLVTICPRQVTIGDRR